MSGHNGARSGGDGCAKGGQFNALQVRAVARDRGEVEMRIRAGIAMAGKMFGGSQASVFLNAADEGGDKFGDARGVFAERSRVDDGIIGVAVHVRVRRKYPGNPYR